MGHMLNNTLQDVLIRRARLKGYNACWIPGTDHASIATEAKVVEKLKSEGINKNDISREDFLEHAWEWTHKHGGIILEQLKKLGSSCDWERTKFTMDKDLSESVIDVFIDLHKKPIIHAFQLVTQRTPRPDEKEILTQGLREYLAHFKANPDAAKSLITIGTSSVPKDLNPVELAAHTTLANVLLNLDEVITKE